MPYGQEPFSSAGSLLHAKARPLAYAFPNLLALFDPPWFVVGLLLAGVAASLLLAVGLHDRVAAVFLWYVWACLFGRNPLIGNPGLTYLGWLFSRTRASPRPPYGSLAARGRRPPAAAGASPRRSSRGLDRDGHGLHYGGLTKLVSPSWRDGSALARVLDNPLARAGLVAGAGQLVARCSCSARDVGRALLEALFAPLALLRRARPWLWLACWACRSRWSC